MLSHDEQAAYQDAIERVRQSAANHLGASRSIAVEFVANLHRAVDKVAQQACESDQKTECRPGCTFCCSVRVEATEPEIFRIAREVKKLPADQVATIIERLQNFAATADGTNGHDKPATPDDETCHARSPHPNPLPMPSPQSSPASGRGCEREKQLLIPAGEGANESLREFHINRTDCAFLDNHLCSIYEVRPAVCRRAHSLSAESCKNFAPEIPQNLEMLLRADALMKGTAAAYRQVGLHASGHELCRAVLLALTNETAEARWRSGESVFSETRT